MRIGTWNLEGRWDGRHRQFIDGLDCDVLLLTEVPERISLPTHELHLGSGVMARSRRWAAVASRVGLLPLDDPHGASAAALVLGMRMCSSVLPWRTCGRGHPWVGDNVAEKTRAAVAAIERSAAVVWGGDWNHAMQEREWVGALEGREAIRGAVNRLGLQVPTSSLASQRDAGLSIDHIAVPAAWDVTDAQRISAHHDGVWISDHDAYVLDVMLPTGSDTEQRFV